MSNHKTNETSIYINKVKKSFGNNTVLKEINLEIIKGEFVAIVGKSGCGKSTLLRIIAGLEEISSGTILINGQDIKKQSSGTRVLFQEPRLLPWKSVIDNIKICSASKEITDAQNALESVALGDKSQEWPNKLSGGQKQRVALARALAANPKILLLDEPLGALDALTRLEMQELIEKLWIEKGFTALLVTHDVSEAVALADRVILIEEGQITMNLKITLARPRIRNSDFNYFEQLILNRIMGKVDDPSRQLEYTI